MINFGSNWDEVHWPDNWTDTTVDGKKSAQFEETLLYVLNDENSDMQTDNDLDRITETGVEILTAGKPFELP
jgi:methionyl aminopeptidase